MTFNHVSEPSQYLLETQLCQALQRASVCWGRTRYNQGTLTGLIYIYHDLIYQTIRMYYMQFLLLLRRKKNRTLSPLPVFLKHGQRDFSKVSNSISDRLTPIFPENFFLPWSKFFKIVKNGQKLFDMVNMVKNDQKLTK